MPKRITTWSRNFGSGSVDAEPVEIGAGLEDELVASGRHRLAFEQRPVAAAILVGDGAGERSAMLARRGAG